MKTNKTKLKHKHKHWTLRRCAAEMCGNKATFCDFGNMEVYFYYLGCDSVLYIYDSTGIFCFWMGICYNRLKYLRHIVSNLLTLHSTVLVFDCLKAKFAF